MNRIVEVLPSLPEFRYVHTCPECGCHNVSLIVLDTWSPCECFTVCSWCGVGYSRRREPEEQEKPEETRAKVSSERWLTAEQREIDTAIERVCRSPGPAVTFGLLGADFSLC